MEQQTSIVTNVRLFARDVPGDSAIIQLCTNDSTRGDDIALVKGLKAIGYEAADTGVLTGMPEFGGTVGVRVGNSSLNADFARLVEDLEGMSIDDGRGRPVVNDATIIDTPGPSVQESLETRRTAENVARAV